MSLCPRCGCHFKTLPDEVGDHPCPRCGLSPWDVILNGREEEEDDDDEKRPYPEGVAWDEAWRQRKRADEAEAELVRVREQLECSRTSARLRQRRCDVAVKQRDEANRRLLDISDELYGKGLLVIGWHMNGDTEPLDSWFEDNEWGPVEGEKDD